MNPSSSSSSFLSSSSSRRIEGESSSPPIPQSSKEGGGIRSFYSHSSTSVPSEISRGGSGEPPSYHHSNYLPSSFISHHNQSKFNVSRSRNHVNNNNNNHYEDDDNELLDTEIPPPSIHFSEEDEEEEFRLLHQLPSGNKSQISKNQTDYCFFDSLTQKWVNIEDFSEFEVPCLEDPSDPQPLRMWDESLSKIEEVTECSSIGRGGETSKAQQRLVLPLNSVHTAASTNTSSNNITNSSRSGNTLHRPILVSTPSSSVSSSPFDKSSPPSLRRQVSSNSSNPGPELLLPSRQHRTLPSSRRGSVDESSPLEESFPVNYSRSSYNNLVLGAKSGKIPSRSGARVPPSNTTGSYNNSPAPERRRKKSLVPPQSLLSPPPSSSNRQNRSQSISNFSRIASSNLNKSKSYSSGNISLKSDYSHVQSKVKAYIKSVKDLPKKPYDFSDSLSAGKKSLSMSNLASTSRIFPSTTSGMNGPYSTTSNIAASNLKSFLSYANLEELTITINKPPSSSNAKSVENLCSKSKFDTSRISRLLDNISDEEAMEEVIDSAAEEGKVDIDLGGILTLAYNEMRDKQEAKKVLSQLQTNYDRLQRKYAEAENTIDKLRFGGGIGSSGVSTSTPLPSKDFLLLASPSSATPPPLKAASSSHSSSLLLGHPTPLLKGGSSSSGGGSSIKQQTSSPVLSSALSREEEKKERHEATKKALMDIQDQLYGLEILSDSLDPKERESAMEDVRRSFHSILVNFDNQRGRGKTDSEGGSDAEMVELLKQIGKKLYVKSPSKVEPPKEVEEEEDPFEKVSNWKTSSANGGSPRPYANLESFGGAKQQSGSKIADILSRQQQQVNDFDSGCCPGSERSVRSKDSRAKQQGDLNRLLPYNNFFSHIKKKKSHASSSLLESSSTTTSIQEDDEEEEESNASKRQIKRVDTDLSSSEPEEDVSSSRQPKALVQQINQDINELRSMFEDHREEMMWLVAQEKQKEGGVFSVGEEGGSSPSSSRRLQQQRGPGDVYVPEEPGTSRPSSSRRSLSSLHFAAVSSSSPPISPSGTRRSLNVLKSPLHSRYHSQSQSLRRLGHIGQVRRKFDSEDTAEDLSMDDREIRRREFERRRKSRLTKRRSRESLNAVDSPEFDEDEVELSTGEQRIFIPKLKLEDLWTDRTGGEEEGGGLSSSSASSSNHHAVLLKGKKKPNKEIKDLLRSLEHANKMATKLKERSEEMLTVLKSEIAQPPGYTPEEVL